MNAPSTDCSTCRVLLGGYVLEALEPDETEAVRAHIATCHECAAELAQLAELPVLLDTVVGHEDLTSESPPVGLEEAVLDRFASEHRPRQAPADPRRARLRAVLARLRRPLPAAVAGAAAAAAITLAIFAIGPGGGSRAQDGYQAHLTGSPAAPGATAFARLDTFSQGTRVHLHVSGLKGSPDAVYELWCVRDDGDKVSAGTFRVDGRGRASVSLTTGALVGEYHRLSVERESFGPSGMSGRQVLGGDIQYGRF